MGFAERIKALREDSDEKQKDIAKLLNVSCSMISFYESGIHFPRDEKAIVTLAKHFNVSTDYLFGITDIPNYRSVTKIVSDISSLSPEALKKLVEYIEFLKFTEKE